MGREAGKSPLFQIEERARRAGWDFEALQGSRPEDRSLILARPSDDGMVELFADGRFAVQFGVDMEEMRNLLTGEQTEDMGDDELVRVARYHLKDQVDRFKPVLLKMGFVQGEDATEDYYAVTFETRLDFSDPDKTMKRLTELLGPLRKNN
ncbi:MAG TPA: hypothetical protein VLB09_08390 [Nitrospiria bacterium]|nr:hypothetical protein [Nitrospiria bacterium]